MKNIDTLTFGRQLNELLVLAVLRSGPQHGYQIAIQAEERSGGSLKLQYGTLYPILHRLERGAQVRGRWTQGGGRRRKVYELTHAGASRLRQETGELKQTFEHIVRMLSR